MACKCAAMLCGDIPNLTTSRRRWSFISAEDAGLAAFGQYTPSHLPLYPQWFIQRFILGEERQASRVMEKRRHPVLFSIRLRKTRLRKRKAKKVGVASQ